MATTRTIAINLVANDKMGAALSNLRRSITETEKAFGKFNTNTTVGVTRTEKTVGGFGTTLSGLFKSVSREGTAAFSTLQTVGGRAATSLTKNWPLALGAISVGLTALPAAATAAASAIVGVLGGGLATIGLIAAAQSKKVQKSFSDLKKHVTKVAKDIAKPFETTLIDISKFARRTFDAFTPDLRDAFKSMAPVLSRFSDQFFASLEQFRPAIKPITDAFNVLLTAMGAALPGIMKSIADSFIILAGIVQKNPNLLPRLIGNIAALLVPLANLLDKLASVQLWMERNRVAIGKVISVLEFFVNPVTAGTKVVNVFRAAISKLVSVFSSAGRIFASTGTKIRSSMTSAFNAATTAVRNAMSRIYTAVRDRSNQVVSVIRGLPSRIKSALGNLSGLLWGAGRSIIQGLINGINAALGALRSTLARVTNLIPSWKGPMDKDKVLLTPAGTAIMGGLIKGITGQLPALRGTLGNVTSAIEMQSPAMASAGLSSVSTAGGMGVAAPVVIEVRSGGSKLDDVIVEIIRRSVRARGGNVQTVLGRG